MRDGALRIVSIESRPLRVPLLEPFVIASARMTSTRALVVEITVERDGERFVGLGEAATLPPVTRETDDEITEALPAARRALAGRAFRSHADLTPLLDRTARDLPIFRAALEAAWLDAVGRAEGVPVAALLDPSLGARTLALRTDITLPITDAPADAARLATGYALRGFDRFKVKVGKDAVHDLAALHAVLDAVPASRLRLDANGGFSAREALRLLDGLGAHRARVECFEQPCSKHDLAGMAEVTAHAGLPVIADESIATDRDLDALLRAKAAHGINLKLVKHGGLVAAHALGQRAKREGLSTMAGAMVETRLGLVAMAHVVWALASTDGRGVDFVDLDTAFLLADDPFRGGWTAEGPDLTIACGAGFGVEGER